MVDHCNLTQRDIGMSCDVECTLVRILRPQDLDEVDQWLSTVACSCLVVIFTSAAAAVAGMLQLHLDPRGMQKLQPP